MANNYIDNYLRRFFFAKGVTAIKFTNIDFYGLAHYNLYRHLLYCLCRQVTERCFSINANVCIVLLLPYTLLQSNQLNCTWHAVLNTFVQKNYRISKTKFSSRNFRGMREQFLIHRAINYALRVALLVYHLIGSNDAYRA